jgi:hypothetical protein
MYSKEYPKFEKDIFRECFSGNGARKVIKGYKIGNMQLQKTLDDYAKIVGQLTLEKGWYEGKLKSLNSITKKSMNVYNEGLNWGAPKEKLALKAA